MHYVILGAGAAGLKAAERLRILDQKGRITVVAEDVSPVSRCLLHHYIAGARALDDLSFVPSYFFGENNIRFINKSACPSIDFDQKVMRLHNGERLRYDRLLIATGARAVLPPVPGLAQAGNVYTLRAFRDAEGIAEVCGTGDRTAVVIGAGLVGMDAAQALLQRGVKVHVVELADRVLPLYLDAPAARLYQTLFEQEGAAFHTGTAVTSAQQNGAGQVCSLVLANGETVPCDFVVVASGARPNLAFSSQKSGNIPRTSSAIEVDDHMRTSTPDVYAAGDVTGISGIWPLAVKQGIVAAENMAGKDSVYQDTFSKINALNFCGLPALSIGEVNPPEDTDSAIETLTSGAVYKKFVTENGILRGALLVGDIAGGGFYAAMVKRGIPLKRAAQRWNENFTDHFAVDEKARYFYAEPTPR
ncbi:NAD(P)/FAD-dependent oxidoreductase [Ethanoligenens harbinense]|uniref:FAD-dependent pyridine nucleotide-disulfide oxidoreductase n=1 Tax=Ethanoligenens harbinense (strain DSM 18485 / JCM 12961 / CGMCC 1.5033 / YUAN-3) TaxID=663278 RepID=E6U4S8_ETHHY|nr:FAD-dependent oxidoreductase [Ethanoligenens harbinense]ADU27813.1 FAD-dependent pyridine nucleotide-disulfide oxidoreductase [Ethanoligenens harbinense YUAN-3]AVQ96838.1 NAD(P)/FAD-dependent oxidoreductase [Ethanoligenens harbinense YUAN-3]AYF39500.1 NAD(P)/FAD-dependent oxidoreductase [Ethanoligenens harbinense]AYF42325.1 NAD(P)/FAD-dependent oxidoreductase [Ethanoligenens harbinense]QCN93079.1 NAD(P)/FAD-dependent oxidoreductase [Ethanoligenens harbinense]